jgi:hypothetical protein
VRREIITWSVVLAVILGAFGATVVILDSSLYSASGFVRGYLDALSRHDADGALKAAGSIAAGDASTALLQRDVMGQFGDIRLVNDSTDATGVHTVVYSYTAGGKAGTSSFEVRRRGTLLGLFSTWQFVTSPLAVVQLAVLHADTFEANGVAQVTPGQNQAIPYLAFVPGAYEFTHESTWLSAEPVRVMTDKPGVAVPARLDIRANAAFGAQVQTQLSAFLDGCAKQQVLLPTGCPFGQTINDRIVTTPAWSLVKYPAVTLVPSSSPSEWIVPPTPGTAHLKVQVKSLFDGSISDFAEDVPFVSSETVAFQPDGTLRLVARLG